MSAFYFGKAIVRNGDIIRCAFVIPLDKRDLSSSAIYDYFTNEISFRHEDLTRPYELSSGSSGTNFIVHGNRIEIFGESEILGKMPKDKIDLLADQLQDAYGYLISIP